MDDTTTIKVYDTTTTKVYVFESIFGLGFTTIVMQLLLGLPGIASKFPFFRTLLDSLALKFSHGPIVWSAFCLIAAICCTLIIIPQLRSNATKLQLLISKVYDLGFLPCFYVIPWFPISVLHVVSHRIPDVIVFVSALYTTVISALKLIGTFEYHMVMCLLIIPQSLLCAMVIVPFYDVFEAAVALFPCIVGYVSVLISHDPLYSHNELSDVHTFCPDETEMVQSKNGHIQLQ